MTTPYVIGIGNAIMDVIAPTSDATLGRLGIEKGIMQLIERDRSEFLMAAQSADHEAQKARLVPGGSVANTLAGLGMMGLKTAFIGRVAADPLVCPMPNRPRRWARSSSIRRWRGMCCRPRARSSS